MNYDPFLDTMLGIGVSGRSRRVERRAPQPNASVTAAAFRGNCLVVVTLEYEFGGLQLHDVKSGRWELAGREQIDLKRFARNIATELRARRINRILLRALADTGSDRPKSIAYKAEAVLQLTRGLKVNLVPSNVVARWATGAEIEVPEPDPGSSSYVNGQKSAIEAAAYGIYFEIN